MMREADQRAMDRSHAFFNELLRRSPSGALARMPTMFSSAAKLIAGAMTALRRVEYHQVSIDQIFRTDAGRSVMHEDLPGKRSAG
jgi:hypothetical protein